MPLARLLAGIVAVAAVATVADWVWDAYGVRDRLWTGLVHGIVVLAAVGGALGAAAGRLVRGLPIGAIAGAGGALIYYAVVAASGGRAVVAALAASWTGMWLLLAAFEGRWIRRGAARRRAPAIAARGVAAALLSGAAFFLVVETLWGPAPEGGRSWTKQLAAWAFAWAPGLLALALDRVRSPRASV